MTESEAVRQETAAIVGLLRRSMVALTHRDFDAWASAWVHAPSIRRISGWSQGGVVVQDGWEEIGPQMKRHFAERTHICYPYGSRFENLNVRVKSDMASVTFDHYELDASREPAPAVYGFTRETRMLEKHSGDWKYTYLSFFHEQPGQFDQALMRVDENATIVEMSRTAAALVGSGETLCVRNGRLRARDRDADRHLLATIRKAATWNPQHGAAIRVPFPLRTPWGSTDCICWIAAALDLTGNVIVTIGDTGASRHRLQNAILVYRLSPAQARLAEKVIEGHGLGAAAEQLGVTVNTARTQLHRMFEKTGVRSQPALVAALLSVTAPTA